MKKQSRKTPHAFKSSAICHLNPFSSFFIGTQLNCLSKSGGQLSYNLPNIMPINEFQPVECEQKLYVPLFELVQITLHLWSCMFSCLYLLAVTTVDHKSLSMAKQEDSGSLNDIVENTTPAWTFTQDYCLCHYMLQSICCDVLIKNSGSLKQRTGIRKIQHSKVKWQGNKHYKLESFLLCKSDACDNL